MNVTRHEIIGLGIIAMALLAIPGIANAEVAHARGFAGASINISVGNSPDDANEMHSLIVSNRSLDNLKRSYGDAICTTNGTSIYAGYVEAATSNSTVAAQVSLLENDTAKLQTLAGAANVSGFRSYKDHVYDPQLEKVTNSINNAISAANLSDNQTAYLRQQKQAEERYIANCKSDQDTALKVYADAKVAQYSQIMGFYQNIANMLGGRGMSIANLQDLIGYATNTIVNPLQLAVNSATNATQIKTALGSYCLFDGCANGTNAHLSAKFRIGAIQDEINMLEANSSFSGNSKLAAAQNDLDNATAILNSVGTSVYTGNQLEQINGYIKDAQNNVQSAQHRSMEDDAHENAQATVHEHENESGE
ncbi:MAG: hypothetical protein KGI00_01820 [Candidatus Micrarchaeota archaeon]|nr:hypothetical protein [Candidatus Micrarchaeota archaeon]MDE1849446.1 hypothetical protein [Candidatus Micrarchaeota archaeon]